MCVKVSQSVALFKVSHIDPLCHIALSMTYTHSNSFTVVTVSQTTLNVSQLCVSVSLCPCVAACRPMFCYSTSLSQGCVTQGGPPRVVLNMTTSGQPEISLGVDVKHMELETLQ